MRIKDPGYGIIAALAAAFLFGAGTPLAKLMLSSAGPGMLAGLFYAGSGLGLALYRALRKKAPARLAPGQWRWLAGAVLSGGVAGPLLLMAGLSGMPSSGASLLLNAESVFTAAIAWWAFKENVDRRVGLGMGLICAGALALGWTGEERFGGAWPAMAILGACLCWGLDNNLTRKVSLADASWIAMVKGLGAGLANVGLALWAGESWPPLALVPGAMAVGFLSYGVSLSLYVVGLRHLGAARAGAYFSAAPFVGAGIGLAFGEPASWGLAAAGALMGAGVWLHLAERHSHWHEHEPMEHEHEHEHGDLHHGHVHGKDDPDLADGRHSHWHRHEAMGHEHEHYPDEHHRHGH